MLEYQKAWLTLIIGAPLCILLLGVILGPFVRAWLEERKRREKYKRTDRRTDEPSPHAKP